MLIPLIDTSILLNAQEAYSAICGADNIEYIFLIASKITKHGSVSMEGRPLPGSNSALFRNAQPEEKSCCTKENVLTGAAVIFLLSLPIIIGIKVDYRWSFITASIEVLAICLAVLCIPCLNCENPQTVSESKTNVAYGYLSS